MEQINLTRNTLEDILKALGRYMDITGETTIRIYKNDDQIELFADRKLCTLKLENETWVPDENL